MPNIFEQKQNLRNAFKAIRSNLTKEEVSKKSEQINQNFITNFLPKIYFRKSEKIFSLYLSSNNEVSTDLIAQYLQKNNIKFSYPKIVKKNHQLDFILAAKNQALEPSKFFSNILEPQDGEKVFPDFIILPLLAFDLDLSRLGMGGGFFDRTIEFIKQKNSSLTTIGLAYDFQRAENKLPFEKTDQKLDFIVTETNIFSAS
ncbi:MAG: 5-formyltetrahydrofolate cyclo-ligase [Proteobacteria bacterium]|nr:5-formyltetrahydrofolate cyclo-ligase [Pseudomonadota bacterium]